MNCAFVDILCGGVCRNFDNALSIFSGPYGSPLSVVTRVDGTTSANVSWAPPDPNLQNGIITYYTVVLTDLMFSMPDRVYNTTFTYYVFTGLEEYARYAFQVAAATQGGLGPLSTSIRFTTFEDGKYLSRTYDVFDISGMQKEHCF